jgi:hypothetical protein
LLPLVDNVIQSNDARENDLSSFDFLSWSDVKEKSLHHKIAIYIPLSNVATSLFSLHG